MSDVEVYSNHLQILQGIGTQFDRTYNRKAYLHNYKSLPLFDNDLSDFVDSRNNLRDLIDEYIRAETDNYLHTNEEE